MSSPLSPFLTDFSPLLQTMERFLGDPSGAASRTSWARTGGVVQPMPLDVYTTDDDAVILAAVPGMRPEDLEITAHQNTVTLSGTVANVADSDEAKRATWYVHELWSGQYRRSVSLPFEIDAEKAAASFEQGIVRIVLPKAERAKPTRIALSGGQATAIGSGGKGQNGAKDGGAAKTS